jgi:hypothetical protein
MDGKANTQAAMEKAIEKPDLPLPAIFFPSKRPGRGSRRGWIKERAGLYRGTSSSPNEPLYGSFSRTNTGERENPGSKY